jgi:hypothetical protein
MYPFRRGGTLSRVGENQTHICSGPSKGKGSMVPWGAANPSALCILGASVPQTNQKVSLPTPRGQITRKTCSSRGDLGPRTSRAFSLRGELVSLSRGGDLSLEGGLGPRASETCPPGATAVLERKQDAQLSSRVPIRLSPIEEQVAPSTTRDQEL